MVFILKSIVGVIVLGLAAVTVFVADAVWNDSGLFYAALGRDRLLRDCTPLAKERLVGKGFAPEDLTFEPRPAISMLSGTPGQSKTISSAFSFSDGPNGMRVDGRMSCVVSGHSIAVDVVVDATPRRVT